MIASFMDSTNLRPEASSLEVAKLCREAVRLEMAAVCINPCRVKLAVDLLLGAQVNVCTVIGFPLGAETIAAKQFQARESLLLGANELDTVINIGALKDANYNLLKKEVAQLARLKEEFDYTLKIIIETALLSPEELETVTKIICDTDADFIKTSTGFSHRGASIEDLALINRYKSRKIKIKASGGISNLESCLEFIGAGADRIGSSSAGFIVEEYKKRGGLLGR